ncbi:cation channel sperm-associated protein 1-like isoform X2 [Tubulanus polymorphus]
MAAEEVEDLELKHRMLAQDHDKYFQSRRPRRRRHSSFSYRSVGNSGKIGLTAQQLPLVPSDFLEKLKKEKHEEVEEEEANTALNDDHLDGKTSAKPKEINKERVKNKLFDKTGPVHHLLYRYVDSKMYSLFILLVILLNTIILVAQTWEEIQVRMGWYISASDNVFLGIYVTECAMKIFVFRKFYFKEGWNLLDFVIVAFSVADFFLPMLIANVGFQMSGAAIFRVLKIFRFVKAIRALRVLRTIRVLNHLQVIMTTCLQSVQSMGAIVGLILLFLYMFAVIGRGLYFEKDPERFGTLYTAAYTLFQLLTLDDWFYIYSDIEANDPGYWHVFFFLLLYIVMEYFIFLNLFVAVLVDNFQLTLEAANEAKKKVKMNTIALEDEEDDDLYFPSSTGSTMSSEDSEEVKPVKMPMDHYYKYGSVQTKELLSDLFQTLAALEYNIQLYHGQQCNLDAIVDLCAETPDDV